MLSSDARKLARAALDEVVTPLRSVTSPQRGWVRAVREALGMTTRQLAARLGISQPALVELEQSEAAGNIQLSSLRRVADGLGCDLVYALVPRSPGGLEQIVRSRASHLARQRLAAVDHTMALEAQEAPDTDPAKRVAEFTEQLYVSRNLWSGM